MKAVWKVVLVLTLITSLSFLSYNDANARGRKGSHRVGGYNSHGKGSHYIGGR